MAHQTTYFCDRCGGAFDGARGYPLSEMSHIAVEAGERGEEGYSLLEADLCDECLSPVQEDFDHILVDHGFRETYRTDTSILQRPPVPSGESEGEA